MKEQKKIRYQSLCACNRREHHGGGKPKHKRIFNINLFYHYLFFLLPLFYSSRCNFTLNNIIFIPIMSSLQNLFFTRDQHSCSKGLQAVTPVSFTQRRHAKKYPQLCCHSSLFLGNSTCESLKSLKESGLARPHATHT